MENLVRRTDIDVSDPDATALMLFKKLPVYNADTDPYEIRLMRLRPLSYDDLNSPDSECRFPLRWATPALMGFELLPEVELAGRPINAAVRLTGVVYSRASRKLYHCINNAWISTTQLCGAVYGFTIYETTETVSADGLYLHTTFCHATPFMITETLGTPATCIAGLYGCKCTLTSPYDTRTEFVAYLGGGGGAIVLCAILALAMALREARMREGRRFVADRGAGQNDVSIGDFLPPQLNDGRSMRGDAMPIVRNRLDAPGRCTYGAQWGLLATAAVSGATGAALVTWAITEVRQGDPDGVPLLMRAAIWACFMVGIVMVLVAEAVRMASTHWVLMGAQGSPKWQYGLEALHLVGAALVEVGIALLLLPTPPDGDTRVFTGVPVWVWVPVTQGLVHVVVHFVMVAQPRLGAFWRVVLSFVRVATLTPLGFYLVRVPCGTSYRD